MRTLYWAISDMKRNKSFLAFFIFSFACGLIMLSMIYSQFLYCQQNSSMLKVIDRHEIGAFNVKYHSQGELKYTNGQISLKKENTKNAYSAIIRMGTSQQDQAYLYLIGDAKTISMFLNGYEPKSNDVFIDARNEKEISKGKLLKENIVANNIILLNDDSRMITKNDLSLLLNDYIVVYKNYEDIGVLDFSTDEMINSMLFIDADDNKIDTFIKNMNQSNEITISKYDYIESQQDKIEGLSRGSLFYTVLFISYLLIFIIMMAVNNYILTNMKIGEYAIHIIYGATKKIIYQRIILYNSIIMLIAIAFYSLLNAIYQYSDYNLAYIGIISFIAWLILTLIPVIRLRKKNIFDNVRGDFS